MPQEKINLLEVKAWKVVSSSSFEIIKCSIKETIPSLKIPVQESPHLLLEALGN